MYIHVIHVITHKGSNQQTPLAATIVTDIHVCDILVEREDQEVQNINPGETGDTFKFYLHRTTMNICTRPAEMLTNTHNSHDH